MDYFEQIQAMHQKVRDFVETHHPSFYVTSIDAYATTYYQQTLASLGEPDTYILSEIQIRFRVSALSLLSQHLVCDVFMASDGTLYLGDQLMGELRRKK